ARVTLSTKGTITGNVVVKGLPFTAENVSAILYAAEVGYWANMTTAVVTLRGFVRPNTTQIELFRATGATVTLTNVATGDLADTTDLVVSVTYRADA
ncbi:MAG: hypothetical protein EBS32_11580, partial [Actinobacteria bacterium]|nr:hypothetical protein [Actinomycetota bacterium]